MDWVNATLHTRETQGDCPAPQITSEPTEESEHNISCLTARFSVRMWKQVASAQGETTPGSEVSSGKCPKQLGLNEEVQKSPTIITSNPPEQASSALPTLEGTSQEASMEACTSLENGTPIGGPPSADNVVGEAPPPETVVGLSLLARRSNFAISSSCKPRGPNRLVLNSLVISMKWYHLSADTSTLGRNAAQSIIDC